MNGKILVERLLEADEPDPKERAYADLQKLVAQRGELQAEQKWNADFSMALHRLHVDPANIKSLDIEDGRLHGIYLRQGDYGAKIQRKNKARAEQDARLEPTHGKSGFPRARQASRNEVSAYYVPINPPMWVPEVVRNRM